MLNLINHFWWILLNDGMSLLRLDHKTKASVLGSPLSFACCERSQRPLFELLYGKTNVARIFLIFLFQWASIWGLPTAMAMSMEVNPSSCWALKWQSSSQYLDCRLVRDPELTDQVKLAPVCWNYEIINICCFNLINLGINCYIKVK